MKMENIVKLGQDKLYSALLKRFDKPIYKKGSYILIEGQSPVLLVAHMDTVHKETVKIICKSDKGNIWMSPQGIGGDDRCGIFALLTAYDRSIVKPWLLFTCDEEIGGVGAEVFAKDYESGKVPDMSEIKFIIEIDRKGKNDAVYYDCDNLDFEEYITSKGYKTNYGSFSDISVVAPTLGIAAVNLSSGYYNAHTLHEYINIAELNATIEKVIGMVSDAVRPDVPQYEYVDYYSYPVIGDVYDYDKLIKDRNIPAEYRDDYIELLDYYTPDEIDVIIEESGEGVDVLPNVCECIYADNVYRKNKSIHDMSEKEYMLYSELW